MQNYSKNVPSNELDWFDIVAFPALYFFKTMHFQFAVDVKIKYGDLFIFLILFDFLSIIDDKFAIMIPRTSEFCWIFNTF